MQKQLTKIEKLLDENYVPHEVWIGTDSTADRVAWLLKNRDIEARTAQHRFEMVKELVFAVNEALKYVETKRRFQTDDESGNVSEEQCLAGLLSQALEFCNPTAQAVLSVKEHYAAK